MDYRTGRNSGFTILEMMVAFDVTPYRPSVVGDIDFGVPPGANFDVSTAPLITTSSDPDNEGLSVHSLRQDDQDPGHTWLRGRYE